MSAAQARAVRALAEPLVAELDCDLEDVVIRQAGRRRLVRVVVDHDGGLSLDLVAELSRAISRALDEDDPFGQAPYVLEVSSPGVDRPLGLPRHWRRAIGRLVEVRRADGSVVVGRLSAADERAATLETDDGPLQVALNEVARATVQVEFTRVEDVELDEAPEGDVDADEPGDPDQEA
jgi:ribosome maturation factor RimP